MFDYDRKIIPKHLNPILTQELKDEVNFFLKWGYLIVNNALNEKEVSTIRAAFDDTLNDKNKLNHIEVGLLEYDERFVFLLDNNPVIKRIEAILGHCIQLHSATARVTNQIHLIKIGIEMVLGQLIQKELLLEVFQDK